jgi:hypothetical protein
MRKKMILGLAICVFFIPFCFFDGHLFAQEETGPANQDIMVNITGRVICADCRASDQIIVKAKERTDATRPDIASVDIAGPGEYVLRVPQNIGNVYVSAIAYSSMGLTPSSLRAGEYIANPLVIRGSDINDINLIIEEFPPRAVMSAYQGPTVTISGRFTYSDYREVQKVDIVAKSSPFMSLGEIINSMPVSGPGEYSLKVPQGYGDIYIYAVIVDPEITPPLRGINYNQGLPLRVESADITGVDIME